MSSWYSSWLPGLPSINFALPSSIQGRFVSFVLKKSLGHLLKPGQLDVHQIDTQIGSGYVQVSNLELDNEAINTLLSGLPVKLHDGSISSATAQIPWPNPLTSTLGFSLDTLHLTFHLLPASNHTQQPNTNLTESVTSVAESFIHDELTPREEATLRESFHPELASSIYSTSGEHNVPGSLDPFLSTPEDEQFYTDLDPAGVSIFASLIERLLARFEFDAVNTKITLVHPGHTSFTISIPEIRYRTAVRVSDRCKDTNEEDELSHGETRTVSISGVTLATCNLRSSLLILPSTSPLTPATLSPTSPSSPSSSRLARNSLHHSPRSVSPTSSSSSIDEDTQFMMSQSLAFLPPRPTSPTSSAASSMYQSAISTAPTVADNIRSRSPSQNLSRSRTRSPGSRGGGREDLRLSESHTEPKANQTELVPKDELILSFGEEPILIQLSTPPPGRFQSTKPELLSPHSSHVSQRELDDTSENLLFSVTTGVVACAVRAWHIRGILDLLDSWGSHHQPRTGTTTETPFNSGPSSTSILGLGLEVSVKVRGVVVLALPHMSRTETVQETSGDVSKSSFFTRPLVPPRLPQGYVRLYLESLSASVLSTISSVSAGSRTRARSSPTTASIDASSVSFDLSLGEFSLFAFHRTLSQAPELDTGPFALPLLITDHHLPTQYPSTHVHPDPTVKPERYPGLPIFDVSDWTDEKHRQNGMKISLWRSKLRHKHSKHGHAQRHSQIQVAPASSSPEEVKVVHVDDRNSTHTSPPPAILVTVKRDFSSSSSEREKGKSPATEEVEVKVVPLHLFVDLGQALSEDGALAFLEEIVGPEVDADLTDGPTRADEEGSDDDEVRSEDEKNTPPTTPHERDDRKRQREREKERQRLEKLVLEDLDLDLDYQVKERGGAQHDVLKGGSTRKRRTRRRETQSNVSIKLPIVRLQIRCSCPPGRPRRSGAFVLDFHDIRLSTGPTPGKPPPWFAVLDYPLPPATSHTPEGSGGNVLLAAECRRIVIANSLVGGSKATTVLSLGPLNSVSDVSDELRSSNTLLSPMQPRITLTKSTPPSMSSSIPTIPTLALSVDIPSVHVKLSKSVLDGLQYWADDAAQLVERAFGTAIGDSDTERADSRDTSLIGSRFFAKSRSGSGSGLSASRGDAASETVVKVAISEAFVRFMLPREKEWSTIVRPFDIIASDVDVLMELKPEGKDETVLTLGVMDLTVADTTSSGSTEIFLSLTTPRSLLSVPKSVLKLRFTSLIVPETTAKETRIKLTLWGLTYNIYPDFSWASEIGRFVKAPPGAFESVIPSERTRISLKIIDSSIRALAPHHPGALVFHLGALDFSTDIVGESPDSSFHLSVPTLALLVVDDLSDRTAEAEAQITSVGVSYWKETGYALLAEIANMDMNARNTNATKSPDTRVVIDRIGLRLHLCADSLTAVTAFSSDLGSAFKPTVDEQAPKPKRGPTMISEQSSSKRGIMSAVDEHAFKQVPEVGPAPDMISDDLPTNLDYLDESFGAAAGLRELRDDDLDEFDVGETEVGRVTPIPGAQQTGIISKVGGETIKILRPEGIHIVENYFDTLPPDAAHETSEIGATTLQIRVHNADVALFLYDGYDWAKTRKTIEDQVKEMRRRLAKIRQLVASGQTQDPSIEETSTVLFNSVYIGLEQDVDDLEPGALIAAIDEELKDDIETTSQSSWQSLRPPATAKPRTRSARVHGKRLTRSRGPSLEFRLSGVDAEVDQYRPDEPIVSRIFATVKDLEIFDHIKTSTWKKFLTELRSDSRGNVRETDSNMVRVELRSVRPVPGHPSEEARLRAKILPLRLYVDQDALDFLKKFFSFKDPNAAPTATGESDNGDIYFQLAEIFPVDLKLDYKPRRVDYRALREGRTIELMNFFHFDGAEMTLRHITLNGITGWPRLFDMLNDLWTPDVKATQLVDVISGVAPIRSVVNVGSGVADLVLLPIAQYKKDGRIVRGVQKGTTAFVKSTAMEAIKLGARLATGTQVILEQAEGVLGGQFKHPITTETLQVPVLGDEFMQRGLDASDEALDSISKYAQQPVDIKEGIQSAYKSLQRNFNSAAQTILAVPMEVYERSGNEGPVHSVIRAVPIAVLKPMIGASEAVSKTLLGLHNSLDPNIRHDIEAKYKHR